MSADKRVLLLLAQGFEDYEAAAFIDVMGWSRDCGLEGVELYSAGLREELRSAWGTNIRPGLLLSEVRPEKFDALALPGGFEEFGFYDDVYDERFLDMIRKFDSSGKPVVAVCVAALALGKAGILQGRPATTYDLGGGKRRRQLEKFGAIVKDERIVRDGNLITSIGPGTALDVAFLLLEMLTSGENVSHLRREMRFDP
jgi:4-methyl-5(b-hydroxyethyl)-thiazole monophosphate biosynthesis